MNKLLVALQELQKARTAEDVFGEVKAKTAVARLYAVKQIYRKLAKATHADLFQEQSEKQMAEEAFKLLQKFWGEAQERIQAGVYGTAKAAPETPKPEAPPMIKTKRWNFTIGEQFKAGGACVIFDGIATAKTGDVRPMFLKVPYDPKDNDLLEREAKVLRVIKDRAYEIVTDDEGREIAERLLLRFPELLESFRFQEPGAKTAKIANAFAKARGFENGWYTLTEIRKQYPKGVTPQVMTFIWNRILEGLTLAHAAGVVHGAITPNHVIIHAKTHGGQIIDWTAACRPAEGETIPYADMDNYPGFFPTEIQERKGRIAFGTDIYMAAWCMIYLLGGDPKTQTIPATVPETIRELLNRCVQPNRANRPMTANAVYEEFRQITYALWGKRKFVELKMPER